MSGDVCVTAINECGPSNQVCTPVIVNDGPEVPELTGADVFVLVM